MANAMSAPLASEHKKRRKHASRAGAHDGAGGLVEDAQRIPLTAATLSEISV